VGQCRLLLAELRKLSGDGGPSRANRTARAVPLQIAIGSRGQWAVGIRVLDTGIRPCPNLEGLTGFTEWPLSDPGWNRGLYRNDQVPVMRWPGRVARTQGIGYTCTRKFVDLFFPAL